MASDEALLTLRIEGTAYGVSKRRACEHHAYRQVWPFPAEVDGVDDPASVVLIPAPREHLSRFVVSTHSGTS